MIWGLNILFSKKSLGFGKCKAQEEKESQQKVLLLQKLWNLLKLPLSGQRGALGSFRSRKMSPIKHRCRSPWAAQCVHSPPQTHVLSLDAAAVSLQCLAQVWICAQNHFQNYDLSKDVLACTGDKINTVTFCTRGDSAQGGGQGHWHSASSPANHSFQQRAWLCPLVSLHPQHTSSAVWIMCTPLNCFCFTKEYLQKQCVKPFCYRHQLIPVTSDFIWLQSIIYVPLSPIIFFPAFPHWTQTLTPFQTAATFSFGAMSNLRAVATVWR